MKKCNAIRFKNVNFMEKATPYALEKYILLKFNAIRYENVRSQKKPSFYAVIKLAFAEIQRYTV